MPVAMFEPMMLEAIRDVQPAVAVAVASGMGLAIGRLWAAGNAKDERNQKNLDNFLEVLARRDRETLEMKHLIADGQHEVASALSDLKQEVRRS